jgi:peptidoglycan/xylan/chitin deacetylase (PgdA/CDA1 family)
MNLTSSPFWLRVLYPKGLVWRIPVSQPEIFLTFDDGPIPDVTPLVLGILRKYNVKATFFCVGENVQRNPEIYNQVISEGHAIGNHTFHHSQALRMGLNEYLTDVEQCRQLVTSNLFRPPHGQITGKIANQLSQDYKIIMWSALTCDYDQKLSGSQCLANAVNNTSPGAIIVFHDSIKARERMEYALPMYIEYCLKKGYTFRTID